MKMNTYFCVVTYWVAFGVFAAEANGVETVVVSATEGESVTLPTGVTVINSNDQNVLYSPETSKKERGGRKRLQRCRQCCLSILQREFEVDDMKGFWDLQRISKEDFNFLLEMVAPNITKKDTRLRKAISPKEKLSVTLWFLATGENFQYQNRTLRRIVRETCAALTSFCTM